MDGFDDFLDDPAGELPDIDLNIELDGNDIMDLDCDPDFNNFLRELADEVRLHMIAVTVQLPTNPGTTRTVSIVCRIPWLALTAPTDVKRRRRTRRRP